MLKVSAAEFERKVGDYEEKALAEPVAITRNGRERLVLLSAEEYWRLKRHDRLVRRSGELSDAELAALPLPMSRRMSVDSKTNTTDRWAHAIARADTRLGHSLQLSLVR